MFHFISGLPRSGSTLLASILRQNPSIHASIMSPVGRIFSDVHTSLGPANEANSFITDKKRRDILKGLFESYYKDCGASIIFDNNRRWTANINVLAALFPDSKIVCCVRTPREIVDSFEHLFFDNPLGLSIIYGGTSNTTIYDRVTALMAPTGVLGFALNAFRSAIYGPHKDKLLCVEYDHLARFAPAVMTELTTALQLPHHNYNFDKIDPIPGAAQFDLDVATPGLHDLKPQVVYEQRASLLPPDLWHNLPPAFWRVKEGATNGS